ncbi:RNA-binding protein 43-like isoform X2 [Chiloscyllium punctatum]
MESNLAERTVAVSGFPEDVLPTTVMIDKLTIHFLRPKHGGGEVEFVCYPTSDPGIAYVTFEKEEVANSVLSKKEHVLEDKQLSKKYPLQVSQCYIFTKVSVDLDLSIFGETTGVVRELESSNKGLQFSACPDGRFHVEGSFSAMKDLRKDVQRRISDFQIFHLPSSVSKSGVKASERKLTRCASEGETQMTKQQKVAAEPSDRVDDVLCPHVFENEAVIILDTDIFEYINALYKEQCEKVLYQYNARAEMVNYDGITALHLVKANDQCEQLHLTKAKFQIEGLVSEMQQLLLCEKIRLDGGSEPILEACKETMQSFPEVLVRFTGDYVSLIGRAHDCTQFKKEVDEKLKSMQSMSNPVFSGQSHIPNASGRSHHFEASLDSSAVCGKYVSKRNERSLNQNCHSGQYASSHADHSQTGYRR